MRFASHRDVARAIERGVRKAGIPVAYSAGFSPHPRISYSGGAPTGSASEAEYLELAVTRRCELDDVGRRLDAALPDGIDVIEVVEAGTASAGLQLEASAWEVTLPGVTPGAAASAVLAFLAESSVEVQRLTSKGTRTLDARAAVIAMTCDASGAAQADAARRAGPEQAAECAILRMIVRQLTPAVRPDDILAALRQLSALEPASPPVVTRLWQGPTSALDTAQTGAKTIAESPIAISQNLRPGPDSPRPEARLAEPGPAQPAMVGRQSEQLPGRKTDKAMRLEAESAVTAPASQTRANEQLPRGTLGQFADPRAREPYGRDCPDARNRATEQTARSR